ncbi:MAG: hypothetical protein DSY82_09540 [Flavobacteriia bacterium]|nr:MAG: hypothetical protein DSY82_09540 [Flavobacteriia bacterium]
MRYILLILIFTILSGCARRSRPDGGPKDEDKPIMVKAKPDFGSTHFNADEIKIYFDEYIKLKDLNKQLIISPPLKYPPIVMPQGTPSKYITIKILDTLRENTTYTFNFGYSVIDNTEGNVLENFKYVISTGDYIDSLKVTGTIKDAFSREQNENVILMLYPVEGEFNDSIVFKEKPTYVGALLDSINFEISNIKEGKYALIALNDKSKNYKYNPKEDKIGFYPNIITAPTDTTYNLVLFKEILPFKFFRRPKEVKKGHILFPYEGKPDSLKIEVFPEDKKISSLITFEQGKDSLHYWFKNYKKDSISFIVSRNAYRDTLKVKLKSEEMDTLRISSGITKGFDLRDTLNVLSNTPVIKIDTSKIVLMNKDSLKQKFNVYQDRNKQKLYIDFEKEYDQKYYLDLFPGAVTDFFGIENDTLKINFSTKRPSNYSSIYLTLKNLKRYPVIVQLITKDGKVEASQYAESAKEVKFENINPSNYMVRIIYDDNKNKRWDTGNYLKKIQPEEVYYFKLLIEARANWEVVETLEL